MREKVYDDDMEDCFSYLRTYAYDLWLILLTETVISPYFVFYGVKNGVLIWVSCLLWASEPAIIASWLFNTPLCCWGILACYGTTVIKVSRWRINFQNNIISRATNHSGNGEGTLCKLTVPFERFFANVTTSICATKWEVQMWFHVSYEISDR